MNILDRTQKPNRLTCFVLSCGLEFLRLEEEEDLRELGAEEDPRPETGNSEGILSELTT